MFEKFGELLAECLSSCETWHHVHSESIGQNEKLTPWREDIWKHPIGWNISHWQNLKQIPSVIVPKHTWKLTHSNSKTPWNLMLQYGVPHNET